MAEGLGRLGDPDPAQRIAALRALRYRDLKDAPVLEAALRACRDLSAAPEAGPVARDPFQAFFGAASHAPHATVGEIAADRLGQTGLPPEDSTVDAIVRVLGEAGPAGTLPAVVARALGETRWASLDRAVASLVPALDPHDEPLYAAIAALPSDATPVLARLAATPLRPRLLQELLNHPPSQPAVLAELERAFVGAARSDSELADVLGVLAAWGAPAAARIATDAAPRAPWAIVWGAAVDGRLAAQASAWLAGGASGAPAGMFERVSAVLRQRGVPDGFPLAAWLRAAGGLHGLSRVADLEDPDLRELLSAWVREGGPRAWSAAAALAEAGQHGPVADLLGERLRQEVRAPDDTLVALARARPVIPGLGDAVAAGTPLQDPATGVRALLALDDSGSQRALVERAIAAAADAPREVVPAGRGLVREQPVGVALDPLQALVDAVNDPALTERWVAVAPVIRAG